MKQAASLLIILLTLRAYSLLWAQGSAGEVIISINERCINILQEPSLQALAKMPERRQKLWEVLEPVLNLTETARRALGRHWRDRTAEERKEFTQIFTNVLKNVYLAKSDSYRGEKIIYLREYIEGNYSKVQTNLITNEGKKVTLDFSMLKSNNSWKIYDITIEGVSIVANYRSQFNSILDKSSFAELIQKLKEKEFTKI